MKDKIITTTANVTLVSSVLWAERVNAYRYAGILVRNTGANPVSVWIETRISDSGVYAQRGIFDLVDIPAGAAKQFDADISVSQWLALVGVATGGTSTVAIELLLSQGWST